MNDYHLFKTSIEMQYQSLTDETSLIVGENGESQLFTSSIQTNQFVSRLRKYLLILLLIQLVSSIKMNFDR